MDSTESEDEEINYELMATTDGENTVTTSVTNKVTSTTFDFDTNNLSELKSLHVSFKSQSLENKRLINETSDLKSKNDFIETELIHML